MKIVVDMQELTAAVAAVPDLDRISALTYRGIDFREQRRQDVAREIVVRAVEIS